MAGGAQAQGPMTSMTRQPMPQVAPGGGGATAAPGTPAQKPPMGAQGPMGMGTGAAGQQGKPAMPSPAMPTGPGPMQKAANPLMARSSSTGMLPSSRVAQAGAGNTLGINQQQQRPVGK